MTEQDELWQLKQETLKSSVSLSEIDQEIFKNFDILLMVNLNFMFQ